MVSVRLRRSCLRIFLLMRILVNTILWKFHRHGSCAESFDNAANFHILDRFHKSLKHFFFQIWSPEISVYFVDSTFQRHPSLVLIEPFSFPGPLAFSKPFYIIFACCFRFFKFLCKLLISMLYFIDKVLFRNSTWEKAMSYNKITFWPT